MTARLPSLAVPFLFAFGSSLAACAGESSKGPESGVPSDGKFDSFARPTDHGELSFGGTVQIEITEEARFHSFTFALDGAAAVQIQTLRGLEKKKAVDTVLYLYRKRPDGSYGPYIAKNDDNGDSQLSLLVETLEAGEYRFLVKGYDDADQGRVGVGLACTGAGCDVLDYAGESCAFGQQYRHIAVSANFKVLESDRYETVADVPAEQADAVFASIAWTYEDATTLAEAFDAIDDGGVNYKRLEEVGGAEYWSFEYGAGDNSYGAVIDATTGDIVVEIHDGDLYECAVEEPAGRWASLTVEGLGGDRTNLPAIASVEGARVVGLPEAGDRIPARALRAVLDGLHTTAGQDCDAVPTGDDIAEGSVFASDWWPHQLTTIIAQQEADGWQSVLSAGERAALDAYVAAKGEDNIDLYELALLDEACGGDGSGLVYILHERQSHTLFYVFSVEYAE